MAARNLVDKIRQQYKANPDRTGEGLEKFLNKVLTGKRPEERLAIVKALAREFSGRQSSSTISQEAEAAILQDLFTKVLGKRLPDDAIPIREMAERLAEALNTIFDSLNQLVRSINATLLGSQPLGDQTIRFVISSQLGGEEANTSLNDYIDQIREAFSIAHKAFQEAAKAKFKEILSELDPEKLEKSLEGSIKFGPLRKAELFDLYKEKFRTIKNWLDTGLLIEATLREFEKKCQKLYSEKRRRK